MSAESGGQKTEAVEREWLLGCEGFRVEGPDGRVVGHVLAPLYGFSARWDRPNALEVRGSEGTFALALDAIAEVTPGERRITLRGLEPETEAPP